MAEELGRQIALQAALLAEADARRVESRVGWAWKNEKGGMRFYCEKNSGEYEYNYNFNQLLADGWIIERTFNVSDHSGEKNFTHLVLIRKKPAAA